MNNLYPYWSFDTNITGYVLNTMSVLALLGSFALVVLIVIGLTSIALKG